MRRGLWLLGCAAWALLAVQAATAQELAGCTSEALRDPPRTLYSCSGGLVIEAEAGADVDLPAASGRGAAGGISLGSKAVLVDVVPGGRGFQIRTPHAIASVRGTVYAVDVSAGTTSVFVSRGRVQVSRVDGSSGVGLGPGEGVDVTSDAPLTVRRWPEQRVQRLLARFGR